MLNALPNQVIFCRRYLLLSFKPILFPELLLCQAVAGETEGLRLIKTVMRHANLGWKVYLVLNVVLVESNIINTYCFSHDVVGDQKQNALRNQLTSSPEERKLVPARINDQNQFQYMTTHCWSVNRYLNLLLVMVVSLFLSKVSWWFDSTFLCRKMPLSSVLSVPFRHSELLELSCWWMVFTLSTNQQVRRYVRNDETRLNNTQLFRTLSL